MDNSVSLDALTPARASLLSQVSYYPTERPEILEIDPETQFLANSVVRKSFVSDAEFSKRGLSGSISSLALPQLGVNLVQTGRIL
jgi:hypothetical protein